MSSSFPNRKTVEWAVHTFRWLMHDLQIGELKVNEHHQINTFDDLYYSNMVKCHIDNCVIVVKRMRFSKADYKGVFIWQYDKETELFGLYIFLNDNLYAVRNAVIRKAVSTHEFTHCTVALMSISELKTKALIQNQMQKMKRSFHALKDSDIKKLIKDMILSLFTKIPEAQRLLEFPDEHFRTGNEDFQGSYVDLYSQLLFSYELFKQYFTDEIVRQIFNWNKEHTNSYNVLVFDMIKRIAREKCLHKKFVELRVRIFLQDEREKLL